MNQYDVILTVGNGLSANWKLPDIVNSRLKYVADLYNRGISRKIIVSGGWSINWDLEGIKPPTTEAENMKKALIDLRVPAKDIFKEEWSRDTIGNAYFSKIKIIKPNNFKNILVVCSDFHLKRVRFLFEKVFGSGFKIDYQTTPTGKMNNKDIIAIEERVLKRQKRFLEKMDNGDDKFLEPKLYSHPYYKVKRSKDIAKIAMKGIN